MFMCLLLYVFVSVKDYVLSFLLVFLTSLIFIHSFNGEKMFNYMMFDFLGYSMILLTLYIFLLMLMSSDFAMLYRNNTYYIFTLLSMLTFMVSVFMVKNIFLFYILFELSLIPVFFLILGWGFQVEKLQSSLYMFFYTLLGSIPFMLILGNFWQEGVWKFMIFSHLSFTGSWKFYFMYMFIFLMFLVKIPLFMLHGWLPKAHVEAPVTGSMILAGVLLKMGGYGLIRLMFMLKGLSVKLEFLKSFTLMGMFIVSILCLKQSDLKMMVAYSSVVHMGTMIAGLCTYFCMSFSGSIYLMLGHGFCSSCLFFLVNYIYSQSGSRSLLITRGSMLMLPSFNFWWFISCIGNISNPPSLSLFGEIFLFSSILKYSHISMLLLVSVFFFTSCYTLYLYIFCTQSFYCSLRRELFSMNLSENFISSFHIMPLNFLIFLI